jgi:hypothetical protein
MGNYVQEGDDWDLANWTPAPDTFQNNGLTLAENEALFREIMGRHKLPG